MGIGEVVQHIGKVARRAGIALVLVAIALSAIIYQAANGYDMTPVVAMFGVYGLIGALIAAIASAASHPRTGPKIKFFTSLLWNAAGLWLIVYAAILFGWQVIEWLRFGNWEPLDLFTLLTTNGPFDSGPRSFIVEFPHGGRLVRWLVHPTDWLGLHTVMRFVLSYTPVTLVSFVLGWMICAEADRLSQSWKIKDENKG